MFREEARKGLCEMIARYGPGVCADLPRAESLLKDLCAPCRLETKVLVSALKEQVPAELLAASGITEQIAADRMVVRLQENLALTEEAARWAVASWAVALGKTPPSPAAKPDNPAVKNGAPTPVQDLGKQGDHAPNQRQTDGAAAGPGAAPRPANQKMLTWVISLIVAGLILLAIGSHHPDNHGGSSGSDAGTPSGATSGDTTHSGSATSSGSTTTDTSGGGATSSGGDSSSSGASSSGGDSSSNGSSNSGGDSSSAGASNSGADSSSTGASNSSGDSSSGSSSSGSADSTSGSSNASNSTGSWKYRWAPVTPGSSTSGTASSGGLWSHSSSNGTASPASNGSASSSSGGGYIGVGFEPVQPVTASLYHLPVVEGVYVRQVDRSGPAARAGVQVRDIILSVDGKTIYNTDQFQNAVRSHAPFSILTCEVIQPGGTHVLRTILVGTRPSS